MNAELAATAMPELREKLRKFLTLQREACYYRRFSGEPSK
jgi:hypothetical protein